ncbi:hypothetical protein COOONC_04264 [Cooperia oncophora]
MQQFKTPCITNCAWLSNPYFPICLDHAAPQTVSCAIVVRINDVGLEEAANCTRQWLSMAGPHFALPDMRAAADWELRSELLSVLEVPLMGTIRIQMTGLISEIDMANVTPDRLEVSNCVARIRDLRLNLHGSVVANVLQLFRASFVKGIRRKLEEDYCTLMEKFWMTWVRGQLSQFSSNLTLNRANPEVVLTQSLEAVVLSRKHIDLEMRSDLIWNGDLMNSEDVVLTQSLEAVVLSRKHIDLEMRSDLIWNGDLMNSEDVSLIDNDTDIPSTRMITIFVEEETVQNILKAAYSTGHFLTTVESPFLQTQCDVLCIGSVLPELSEAMPNSSLVAQVSQTTRPYSYSDIAISFNSVFG